MSCQIAVLSTVGVGAERGGRLRNEDNTLVCHQGRVSYVRSDVEHVEHVDGKGVLVALCDGMGGHDNGHLASAIAVRALSRLYAGRVPADPLRVLRRYVLDAHRELYWRAMERHAAVQMGTTLTVVWIFGEVAYWLQIGDSRLYHLRGAQLKQISRDQTRNEFARRDGQSLNAEGHHLAQSFIYGSRGLLGDNSRLRLESELDYGVLSLQLGDELLLCSDGVSGVLSDDELRAHLLSAVSPADSVSELVSSAIEAGSLDNISAMVLQVHSFTDDDDPDCLDDCDDECTMFF